MSSRNYSIDSIKFFAIVFVIVIHVAPFKETLLGDLLNQTARFAVPYFFIVAGFLFFKSISKNNSDPISAMTKYGSRLLNIYLFWFVIYALWPLYAPENWENIALNGFLHELSVWKLDFISNFLNDIPHYIASGGNGYHLWFLPSLGIAIFLLAIFLKFDAFRVGLYFSILMFIFALLDAPYRESAVGLPFKFDPRNGPFFSSIFVFIGAFLAKYEIKVTLRTALTITLLGLLLSVFEVLLINYLYDTPITSHNFVIGTVPYGLGVALVTTSCKNLGVSYNFHKIGPITLGIYAVHLLVIQFLMSIHIYPADDLGKLFFVVILSIVITIIFSRVPFINKVFS